MEDVVLLNIRNKLNELGEAYDMLKPFMQERLNDIELYIIKKKQARESGLELIKSAKFSVKSIADEIECSRTTLYNHDQLLKRYIELSIDQREDDGYIQQNKLLKEEVRKLKSIIEKNAGSGYRDRETKGRKQTARTKTEGRAGIL